MNETVLVVEQRVHAVDVAGGLTVAVVAQERLQVVTVGQQGPPGAGDAGYTHTQSIALAIWTAAHNLNRFPSVTVVDNLGRRIEPDVSFVDADIVQISHGLALTGKAYFN